MIKYLVLGGVPQPSGGVTVFNGDVVLFLEQQDVGVTVLDGNPGVKEARFCNVRVLTRKAPKPLFFIFEVLYSAFSRSQRILLHSSRTLGVLKIAIPLLVGRSCVVFLHNGNPVSINRIPFFQDIIRNLFGRIDLVVCVGENQRRLLESARLSAKKIEVAAPIMHRYSLGADTGRPLPSSIVDRPYLVMCGHETRIYNYEFGIQFAQATAETKVVLFLYGQPKDPGYLEELRALDKEERLVVLRDCNRAQFIEVLERAVLFVRPNHVDSYGVSVHEAVSLGVPVVASNVCDRADGAFTFASRDYDDFCEKVRLALSNSIGRARCLSDSFDLKMPRLIKALVDEDLR